jgi:glycosyltransferase involved in cell wall biosynthesis
LKDNKCARFCFFPDVYDNTDSFVKPRTKSNRYFFTGGMTNRDWNLVLEIAKSLPNERFVCCALPEDFGKQKREIPNNVEFYFNLPSSEYYKLMGDSYCVLLPLKNNAVAGLINIIKALQLGVPCCVSETTATKQYFHSKNRDYLLPKHLKAWVVQIKHITEIPDSEYIQTVQEMQGFIQKNFSPESGIKRLQLIITQINNNTFHK